MKHRMGIAAWTLVALACLAAAPRAQAQGTGSAQSSQQAQPAQRPSLKNPGQQTPAPPPVDPKEEAAYKAFYVMNPVSQADYDAEITAGETFAKTYPKSRYLPSVYSRLTNAYFEKHELDKMYAEAQKTLQVNPDDVSVLTLVGWVIPRDNPSAPDFTQKLAQAEQYETHALALLANLPKPPTLTDAQFAETKAGAVAQAHSGLGLVYFREGKFDQSSAELQKATQIKDPDPTDYFVLAVDQENLQKFSDAAKSFSSCAQIASSLQDRCKQGAAEAKAKAANQLQPPKS